MSVEIRVDIRQVEAYLRRIAKESGTEIVRDAVGFAAENIMGKARREAPIKLGNLQNADNILFSGNGSARFGFNAPYAGAMDVGYKVPYIRPVRAKALFIALSKAAARVGPSMASWGAYGQDFVWAGKVKTPKPRRGQRKGPNFYFSGTLKDFAKNGKILDDVATIVRKRLAARSRSGGGSRP